MPNAPDTMTTKWSSGLTIFNILASKTLVPLEVRIITLFLVPKIGFKWLNASSAIASKSEERWPTIDKLSACVISSGTGVGPGVNNKGS